MSVVELQTRPRTEISLPLTSYEQGKLIARQHGVDSIRSKGSTITGSDHWIDLVMNRQTELNAIGRFKQNFDRYVSPDLTNQEKTALFDYLLNQYLLSQYQFCLAENGCNKRLQIQPDYHFAVSQDENGLFVTPVDIAQFGDLAKQYQNTNPRVGSGLVSIYQRMISGEVSRLFVGIMSPSEEYQQYGSDWDVINLFIQTGYESGVATGTGKYFICQHKLSLEQRRFVHNLFYELGQQQYTLEDLAGMNRQQLIGLITTSHLQTPASLSENLAEHQKLVAYPNMCQLPNADTDLFSLGCQLNQVFNTRFGEPLFDQNDIAMYPYIQELAAEYLPRLKTALFTSETEYKAVLRQMIYHCQAIWASLQQPQSSTNFHSETEWATDWAFDPRISQHLYDLQSGVILAGFEFASNTMTDWFSSYSLFPWENQFQTTDVYNIHLNKPFGNEITHKCKIHGDYEGDHCPKCDKHIES